MQPGKKKKSHQYLEHKQHVPRAITAARRPLLNCVCLAREAQGYGASQGPEPVAVQRLYFNVYLLQRETAFGFEPLMRKKYIYYRAQKHCVACHWVKG